MRKTLTLGSLGATTALALALATGGSAGDNLPFGAESYHEPGRGGDSYAIVAGVGLKADSNEVAVEGLTLDHSGFEIT